MPLPNDEGDDQTYPSSQIAKNLRYPPPAVIVFSGYLGKALHRPPAGEDVPDDEGEVLEPSNATEAYWRLYKSLQLDEYIEFREADVVWNETLNVVDGPAQLSGQVVWLKAGARIEHVRVTSIELQARFLQGPVASSGSAMPTAPGGQGQWFGADPGGGASVFCGGASVFCGGASVFCGGVSFSCP